MKKQKKYILFIIVVLMSTFFVNICKGQTRDDEIVYYNNPDIISGRFADTNNFSPESNVELQTGTRIVFADVSEAKKILATRDEYIQSLTPYDRSLRLKTNKAVSEEEFLKHVSDQAIEWSSYDKTRLKRIIESIAKKIEHLELNLPPTILLVKTTGKDEGGAGYCRQYAIILPQNIIAQQNIMFLGDDYLEDMLIHELFHIYMTHNPTLEEKFCGIINFKKCDPIKLPENLRKIEVTNPDVPKNIYYIELLNKDDILNVMPIISVPKYDFKMGDEFFQHLKVQLLVIEKAGDKWRCKRDDNGEPVLFEIRDLPSYRKETGDNTSYVIHPEEILAENFVLLVQKSKAVKSKWVIEEMEKLFKKEASQGYGIH